MANKVMYNKMSSAFINAFEECVKQGHNPGRVGHRILTNKASGLVGVIHQPRQKKQEHKAATAVGAIHA